MGLQALAGTMQHTFGLGFTHVAEGSSLFERIQKEISGDKQSAWLMGKATQVRADRLCQKFVVGSLFGGIAVGKAVGQFIQRQGIPGCLTFLAMVSPEYIDGDPSSDLCQISRKDAWAMRWHRIPGMEVGVVDAFHAVFQIRQDVVCDFS